jgi:hypothetical protein
MKQVLNTGTQLCGHDYTVQSCNDSDNLDAEDIFHISHFETLPVTSDAIARETLRG